EQGPQPVGRADDVDPIPRHPPLGGPGDGGEDPHQRRLPGAVGPQQAEHAGPQIQAEIAETTESPLVALSCSLDRELHAGSSSWLITPEGEEGYGVIDLSATT